MLVRHLSNREKKFFCISLLLFLGEACIAQFYYDDLWHRAEVIEFLNNLTLDTVPYQKQQEIRRESLVRFFDLFLYTTLEFLKKYDDCM